MKQYQIMKESGDALDRMNENDRKNTLMFLSVLAEPHTRKIMAYLTKKGPIDVKNIPEIENMSRAQIILRLTKLEMYGLALSEKIIESDRFYKKYSINTRGKKWTNEIMKVELSKIH